MNEQERPGLEVEQGAGKAPEWDNLAEEVPFNAELPVEPVSEDAEPAELTPPVESVENESNQNEKLKGLLLQKIESGDNKDLFEARNMLCEHALGANVREITTELVAFGVIELPDGFDKGGDMGQMEVTRSFVEGKTGWNPDSINVNALKELRESGKISEDEERIVLTVGAMLVNGKEGIKDNLSLLDNEEGGREAAKFMDVLEKVRKCLREEAAEKYTEYMQEKLKDGLVDTGKTIESDGKEVQILRMEGDEFMLLAHKLSDYRFNSNSLHPEKWDSITPDNGWYQNGGPARAKYISTTAISDKSLSLAKGYKKKKDVVYGFSEIPSEGFCFSAEYDLQPMPSGKEGNAVSIHRQDFFYKEPKDIIDRTLERDAKKGERYNEVILDRYSGDKSVNEGRLHPNYIIVYGRRARDINKLAAKHAAYFGVPILLIDPKKYGEKKKR